MKYVESIIFLDEAVDGLETAKALMRKKKQASVCILRLRSSLILTFAKVPGVSQFSSIIFPATRHRVWLSIQLNDSQIFCKCQYIIFHEIL
jgi:hypothetical protein